MMVPALCLVTLSCAAALAAGAAEAAEPARNPALLAMEPNKWLKLHEQQPTDVPRIRRQAHGGSCFDSKRGRLVLFGSDTHGQDWTNSPLLFDPVSCTWTRLYPDSPPDTYVANDQGLPVCGPEGDKPWAMHTFGAVIYDSARDEMVVCSAPLHMVPGRFTNALAHVWDTVKAHPTWTFLFGTEKWAPLAAPAVHFFPYAAAYDTDRSVILGYRPEGVYELSGEPRTWKRLVKGGMFGWHNNAAYDSKHKALVNFGTNTNSNDVVAYYTQTQEHVKMPTPGVRPPEGQHTPMEFDPESGVTVFVIDRVLAQDDRGRPIKTQAETWLYDLGADAWRQLPEATLPFGVGMNYNLEYDPGHKCLLLVTGDRPVVWALRVNRDRL